MAAAVVFNYAAWIVAYPQFGPSGATPVAEPQAQAAFDMAGTFFRNDGTSPATTDAIQQNLMWLLTAHLVTLNLRAAGGQPVGRISEASEGSVSVSFDYGVPATPSEVFFIQTPYGAQFWLATTPYRRFRYRARPTSSYGNSGRWPYGGW